MTGRPSRKLMRCLKVLAAKCRSKRFWLSKLRLWPVQELFACFIMTACLHRKHFTPQFDATGAEVGRQGVRRRGDEYVYKDTKGGGMGWVGPRPFNTRSRGSGFR